MSPRLRLPPSGSAPARLLALAALVLGLVRPAGAQQPVIPPIAPPPVQALPVPGGTLNGVAAITSSADVNPITLPSDALPPLYTAGPFAFQPHLLYRLLDASGIEATPGHHESTTINTIAPGLLVDLGDHWTVDYTPSWNFYSNRAFKNAVDQTVYITGNESYDDWTVVFDQSYIKSEDPSMETGTQTDEQDFTTSLSLAHPLSERLSFEADFFQFLRYAENYPDGNDWSNVDWINYALTRQLELGLGMGLGYVKDSGQPDAGYSNPQARLVWRPGEKLTVSLDAGSEHREFYGHPRTGITSPTYEAYADYALLATTMIKAAAGRQIADSYFISETTKNTFWNVNVAQELLQYFELTAGVADDQIDYVSTLSGPDTLRRDHQITYSGRLSWRFLRRGKIALIVDDTRDRSSLVEYGYSSRQVGVELTYRF